MKRFLTMAILLLSLLFLVPCGRASNECPVCGKKATYSSVPDGKTGNAPFNLDESNDMKGSAIQRTDRSGIIITFIHWIAAGFTGVGWGVYTPTLPST
jgi:hypothetical protein